MTESERTLTVAKLEDIRDDLNEINRLLAKKGNIAKEIDLLNAETIRIESESSYDDMADTICKQIVGRFKKNFKIISLIFFIIFEVVFVSIVENQKEISSMFSIAVLGVLSYIVIFAITSIVEHILCVSLNKRMKKIQDEVSIGEIENDIH